MKNGNGLRILFSIKSAIAFLIGLVFFVLGIYLLINPTEYEYTADAVISKIEVTGGEWEDDGDSSVYRETYTVYVDYVFQGREIKNAALSSYDSRMKVGDSIEIQFNSDDLMFVSQTGFDLLPVVLIVMGGGAVALGIFEILKRPRAAV